MTRLAVLHAWSKYIKKIEADNDFNCEISTEFIADVQKLSKELKAKDNAYMLYMIHEKDAINKNMNNNEERFTHFMIIFYTRR